MDHPRSRIGRRRQAILPLLMLGLIAVSSFALGRSEAGQKKPNIKKPDAAKKPIASPPPRSALLKEEDWQRAPLIPLQPGELDDLVIRELRTDKIEPAPLTTDEQFIRRVTL